MASQNQFLHCAVAWSWARDVCYALWLVHSPHPLLNFSSFFPEGLFYRAFKIFFFFFALHKVLTHVANGCMLVVCLIILPV